MTWIAGAAAHSAPTRRTEPLQPARAVARRVASWMLFSLSLVAFIGALEFTYAEFMATRFRYLGYAYSEPPREWMAATFVLLLIAASFFPFRTRQISGFMVWFLYAALLVPVSTVPLFGSTRDPFDTFLFALFCTIVWTAVALVVRREPSPLIPIWRGGSGAFWFVVVSLSALTYLLIHLAFGIQLNLVSVFEVYDTRLLYRDEVIPTIPLLGYLIANQGNVVNPILMALGVVRRKWMLAAIGALGQLVLYSTAGYKTVLISIPLSLAIALFFRYRRSLAGIAVFVAATALVWVCIAIDWIASLGLVDIVVSRIFLTAGYLQVLYRNVYDGQPWALWDYSFLGPLVDTPYTMSPGFYVGTYGIGRSDVQANAGLFADGYANAGLLGIVVEAVALVIIILLSDSAARGLPLAVALPTALLPVFALANGSPFTAVLSYGFALMILLFLLLPRDLPSEAGEALSGPGASTGLKAQRLDERLRRVA